MWERLIETEEKFSSFLLRVVLGIVIFPHGAAKLLGWFGGYGFGGTIEFMTGQMGIPWILAVGVVVGEFFGGLGLISGLLTRFAAAGTGIIIAVAALLVHLQHGFFMNWSGSQAGEGYEYHLLYVAIAVSVAIRGGGRWSLDGALYDRLLRSRSNR